MSAGGGEFAAIARLRARLPEPPDGELWLGDDAAVLAAPRAGSFEVLSIDACVAGVHVDLSLVGLEDFGWKALSAAVSDVAAMGADPGHALVAVVGAGPGVVEPLYRGLASAAAELDCPLVGGDLSVGPGGAPAEGAGHLSVSVAVTGTVSDRPPPVRRSGARPGDVLAVTGPLGASAAGLRLLRAGVEAGPLVEAHRRPRALVGAGRLLRRSGVHAMIDVSDGTGADLGHLADASEVGFELEGVPVAPGATIEEALGGGEDYQLVFATPDLAPVQAAFAAAGLDPPLRLGVCVADPECRTLRGRPLERSGWEHRWG